MTYDHTIAVGAPPREARPSELSTINMTIDQLVAMLDRKALAPKRNAESYEDISNLKINEKPV